MSDDQIENALEAWARWVGGSRWNASRCGSAERMFRAPAVADDQARSPMPRPFVEWQLMEIERAVAALPLPLARLIRLVYAARRDPLPAMRIARVKPVHRKAWPVHQQAAFNLLRQRLRV